MMEQAQELLAALAAQLGVGADMVWQTLILQMQLYGVNYLGGGLFFFAIALTTIFYVRPNTKCYVLERGYLARRTDEVNEAETFEARVGVLAIGFAFAGFATLLTLFGLMRLLNPEYYALSELSHLLGRLI